jgi:biopolymer transport protein ExbB
MWDYSLVQLFYKGGLIMWPLLICSVVALAIIFEKILHFARLRYPRRAFLDELHTNLLRGDFDAALRFAEKWQHPVPKIAAIYLKNLDQPESLRTEIIKREGSLELERMERRLRALAAITHIAPLLGLLGTVAGLVTAFARIESLAGVVRPGDLAGGIWEALLTTVFGLCVAIPAMAAFHGFESRADKIAREMQFIVTTLDEWIGKSTGGRFEIIKHDENMAVIS